MQRPAGVSKRRQSIARACEACQRRKVSCNKMRPRCSRCVASDLNCHYAFANVNADGSLPFIDETPVVSGQQGAIQSRLERLGGFISDLTPLNVEDSFTVDQNTLDYVEIEDPGHLFKGPHTKHKYLSKTAVALISEEISAVSDLLRSQEQYVINRPIRPSYQAADSGSQRRWFGGEQETINRTPKPAYGDIFPHVPSWPMREEHSSVPSHWTSLEEIVAEMPTKDQCDTLVWAYMRGYHTLNPVFHGPSFLQEVSQFQQWMNGDYPDYDLSAHRMAVLTAVIFGGSVVCPLSNLQDVFGSLSREAISTRFYNLAISAIRLSNFPQSPSLQSFAAFLIVDTTWLREEQPLTRCAFIGVAFRVAQMLGLHKEPSQFSGLSPIEIQVRCLLWWSLVAADAQVAYASGLPTLIECSLSEVQPMSVISEAGLAEPVSSQTVSDETIWSIFTRGKYRFYQSSNDFLRLLHNNVLSKHALDEILEIAQRIRRDVNACAAKINSIEQALQSNRDGDEDENRRTLQHMQSNVILARFSKTLLSIFAAKPYAIMYGPFRRHGLLPYLRGKEPNAMMNCREYLHKFLLLTQCHDYQPWHWCWPGQHQPLHSIMALIMDLNDFPTGPVARETRKLVDLALSMCGQDAGNSGITCSQNGDPITRSLHDGGHEVWKFIRRARDQCWAKAGLDPSVLTCPADAREIHFEDQSAGVLADPPILTGPFHESATANVPFDVGDWSFFGDFLDTSAMSN